MQVNFCKPIVGFFCCWALCISVGCGNRQGYEAATTAAQLVSAGDVEVDRLDEATGVVYDVQLLEARWNNSFSDDDVLSTCALAFFNNLSTQESPDYVRMQIRRGKKTIQRTFSSSELMLADQAIDRVIDFFEWHPRMGMDSLRPMIDPLFFPDSLIEKIGQSVLQQDTIDNALKHTEVVGFESDTVGGIPVVNVKVNAVRKQTRMRYDAFVRVPQLLVLLVAPAEE